MIRSLRLFRFSLACFVTLPLLGSPQNPNSVAYDVSIVKPHDPADRNMSWQMDQDGFRALNVDMKNVIASAWDVRPDQVTGEPSWVDDLHWDMTAKATDLTSDQLRKLRRQAAERNDAEAP